MGDENILKKPIGHFRNNSIISKISEELLHCLICDDTITAHNGYDIFCTFLPNEGGLLSESVNKVLQRDLSAVTARSAFLCNRCFLLFEDLSLAEKRTSTIKEEVTRYYLETANIYSDNIPKSILDVGIQTEEPDCNSSCEENSIKMNKHDIGGHSLRINHSRQSRSATKIKGGSEKRAAKVAAKKNNSEGSESMDDLENLSLQDRMRSNKEGDCSRRTLSKRNRYIPPVQVFMKSSDSMSPVSIKDDAEVSRNSNDSLELFTYADDCDSNSGDVVEEETNIFSNDYYNCDDDFEWKEEVKKTPKKEVVIKQEKAPPLKDAKSHSSNKKRLKRHDRGDRKGERAFMLPVHECNQCGKKWRTITELKSHVASHSDLRPYVCEICGQAYKLKKALDIHIGMHNGIHPFVCNYCNKSFTQKVGLEKHLPIHTGVTRFQCDLCGKRFIHQKSFNIHKMTHTGEKHIRCPLCNLAVFSQSHLKRHYRVHTGERPYGCDICGKKFAEKYNLNAHVRIHDPNSGSEGRKRCHTCPICGIMYERKHKMIDHLSTVHGICPNPSQDIKSTDFYLEQHLQVPQQHHLVTPHQQSLSSAHQQQQNLCQQQSSQHPLSESHQHDSMHLQLPVTSHQTEPHQLLIPTHHLQPSQMSHLLPAVTSSTSHHTSSLQPISSVF